MFQSNAIFGELTLSELERSGQWPTRRKTVWVYVHNAVAIEYSAKKKATVSVSLYGSPVEYQKAGLFGLHVRDAQAGYSRITINDPGQIPMALLFIAEAHRMKLRAMAARNIRHARAWAKRHAAVAVPVKITP